MSMDWAGSTEFFSLDAIHTHIYIYVSVSTKTRQGVIESEFFAFPFSGKQSLPEFLKL